MYLYMYIVFIYVSTSIVKLFYVIFKNKDIKIEIF